MHYLIEIMMMATSLSPSEILIEALLETDTGELCCWTELLTFKFYY